MKKYNSSDKKKKKKKLKEFAPRRIVLQEMPKVLQKEGKLRGSEIQIYFKKVYLNNKDG